VRVGSYYFEDATRGDGRVVVAAGDRITFSIEGKAQHTATVDGWFSSGRRSPGQRWTTPALTRLGTFTLYCQVHGAPRHGTVLVVRRAAAPSPSSTRKPPSPAPSRAPSPTPAPPSPSPSAAPSESPSPTARPSFAPTSRTPSALPSPSGSPTESPAPAVGAGDTPDLQPAGPLDDGGPDVLLPASLLGLVLLGTAAIALGRRRRS
jgi:hypothetical protein